VIYEILDKVFCMSCIAAYAVIAQGVAAQDSPAAASKPKTPPPASDVQTRITIEVTGGERAFPLRTPACT